MCCGMLKTGPSCFQKNYYHIMYLRFAEICDKIIRECVAIRYCDFAFLNWRKDRESI